MPAMRKNKPEMFFTVATEAGNYPDAPTEIIARPSYVHADGDIVSASYGYSEAPARELEDFSVRMYLPNARMEDPYGLRYDFRRYSVELRDAEEMVKVLRKLRTGLDRLDTAEGYVIPGDFATYLIRVGRVLGVTGRPRVRATSRGFDMTGERWRPVDAPGLQMWVKDVIGDRGASLVR